MLNHRNSYNILYNKSQIKYGKKMDWTKKTSKLLISEKAERVEKDAATCKDKNCNEILVPDWTSRIDSRYCKSCLD